MLTLNEDESFVKKEFRYLNIITEVYSWTTQSGIDIDFIWQDSMKSMLGKKFKILSKRIGMGDSAIIALPSQDGSLNAGEFLTGGKYAKRKKWEDSNWYFPKTVVTKIQPKTTPKNSKVFLKICITSLLIPTIFYTS